MLLPCCPQCVEPVHERGPAVECPAHGVVTPLWRPSEATYAAFVDHLARAGDFPTLLPWPIGPGWQISDFGVVAAADRSPIATMACFSGLTDLDGPVDVLIVSEEAGTGLGARVARLDRSYPPEPGDEPPAAKVRVGSTTVALWTVSTSGTDQEFDRTVLVGEEAGRWLWVILYPAPAVLLLQQDWILRDAAGAGALLVELAFGGAPPRW